MSTKPGQLQLQDDDGDWGQATCGYGSYFGIKRDGSLWVWGENWEGQLGLGDSGFESQLARQEGLPPCTQIASGSRHVLAIDEEGRLWAWGRNESGQLGLGDTSPRQHPVLVDAYSVWSWVSASGQSSAAIRADGSLWAWGRNNGGQLGVGDRDSRVWPTLVADGMRWTQVSVGSVSGAIAEDGSLWAWGDYLRPTPFGNMRLAPGLISRYGTWLSLCCGGGVLRVLAGDGTIWHVTRRSTLARRTQPLLKTPLDFFDDPAFDDVSEAMRITQATPSAGWVRATLGEDRLAIRADGTLWARRDDEDGTLELDDVVRGWGLLRFGSDTDWVEVKSAGGATLALKADGSLWGWGTAAPGPMGTPPRLSPERIDGRSNWVQVEPGHDRCFALRADGCLFWWGHAFDWDRRREVPVRVPVS